MEVFQWDQSFATGLTRIDTQHHRLLDVTNEFGSLLSQDGVVSADIERVYTELLSYTKNHFEEEEEFMTSEGVDERHVNHQKQEHQCFLEEVTLMYANLDAANNDSGQLLLEFLMSWLVYHILGSDMCMARQVAAINAGKSAAEAYLAEEQELDKATGPLLKSLNNLFQQVSSRNKQLVELNQTLETKVAQRTESLTEANQKLEELALTDVLTGLPNRRHAMRSLAQLWDEALDKGISLACLMIDADGFKRINDSYGHDAGDIVLCQLAKQLSYTVRSDDIVCRLGGDEFLIICPNTDQEGAMHIADLTQAKIADLIVPVADGGAWQGSISVGVAVSTTAMKTPDELIKAADNGVYAAKAAGRNCVRMVD